MGSSHHYQGHGNTQERVACQGLRIYVCVEYIHIHAYVHNIQYENVIHIFYNIKCYNVYILSHILNFIAILDCMKIPAASCPLKPGIMSCPTESSSLFNLMSVFFERQTRVSTLETDCMGLH